MSDEMQALCFLAGANSIFYGEKLLTTGNPDVERDRRLFARLGLERERPAGRSKLRHCARARAVCRGHCGCGRNRDEARLG